MLKVQVELKVCATVWSAMACAVSNIHVLPTSSVPRKAPTVDNNGKTVDTRPITTCLSLRLSTTIPPVAKFGVRLRKFDQSIDSTVGCQNLNRFWRTNRVSEPLIKVQSAKSCLDTLDRVVVFSVAEIQTFIVQCDH